MKSSDLLTFVALAALGYVAFKVIKPTTGTASVTAASAKTYANGYTNQIANSASPGDAAWGWSYFTDGTAIGPDGSYYAPSGAKVWSPNA